MVATAVKFVAGEVHFSYMVGPTERCVWWARVHGAHPAIVSLAQEWQEMANDVWNEGGHLPKALPVEEFRQSVAADLNVTRSG
jgi:hypothetical protein